MGAGLLEYKSQAGASFSYSALSITAAGQRLLAPAGAAQKLVFQVGAGAVGAAAGPGAAAVEAGAAAGAGAGTK
jgi:hypothetical protein